MSRRFTQLIPFLAGQPHATPPEAAEFLAPGDAIDRRPPPLGSRAVLYLMVSAVIAFLIWASLSELDQVVVARGRLIPLEPPIAQSPVETVVVKRIMVRTGDVVKAGQPLVSFDPTVSDADVRGLEGQIDALDARIARLRAELDGSDYVPPSASVAALTEGRLLADRRAFQAARLRAADAAVAGIDAQIDASRQAAQVLRDRLAQLREWEGMRKTLVGKDAGSRSQVLEIGIERAEAENILLEAVNRPAQLAGDRARIIAEREADVKSWREESFRQLTQTSAERDAQADQLSKAQWRRSMAELKAPVDGVVLEVARLAAGSVVREAEPVVTLVPVNAPLEAEVRVSSADIGFLRVGDRTRVKIDAFPFQRHGALDGVVRVISEDSFMVGGNGGTGTPAGSSMGASRPAPDAEGQEAFYLVRIALNPESRLTELPPHLRMLPGLTVTGEIVTGTRTVAAYLIYPLARTMDEGLRER